MDVAGGFITPGEHPRGREHVEAVVRRTQIDASAGIDGGRRSRDEAPGLVAPLQRPAEGAGEQATDIRGDVDAPGVSVEGRGGGDEVPRVVAPGQGPGRRHRVDPIVIGAVIGGPVRADDRGRLDGVPRGVRPGERHRRASVQLARAGARGIAAEHRPRVHLRKTGRPRRPYRRDHRTSDEELHRLLLPSGALRGARSPYHARRIAQRRREVVTTMQPECKKCRATRPARRAGPTNPAKSPVDPRTLLAYHCTGSLARRGKAVRIRCCPRNCKRRRDTPSGHWCKRPPRPPCREGRKGTHCREPGNLASLYSPG